jgi:hypothetical protein
MNECRVFSSDDHQIFKTPKIQLKQEEDVHSVRINPVLKKNIGVYKVVATNKYGSVTHEAKLDVTGEICATAIDIFCGDALLAN